LIHDDKKIFRPEIDKEAYGNVIKILETNNAKREGGSF